MESVIYVLFKWVGFVASKRVWRSYHPGEMGSSSNTNTFSPIINVDMVCSARRFRRDNEPGGQTVGIRDGETVLERGGVERPLLRDYRVVHERDGQRDLWILAVVLCI